MQAEIVLPCDSDEEDYHDLNAALESLQIFWPNLPDIPSGGASARMRDRARAVLAWLNRIRGGRAGRLGTGVPA